MWKCLLRLKNHHICGLQSRYTDCSICVLSCGCEARPHNSQTALKCLLPGVKESAAAAAGSVSLSARVRTSSQDEKDDDLATWRVGSGRVGSHLSEGELKVWYMGAVLKTAAKICISNYGRFLRDEGGELGWLAQIFSPSSSSIRLFCRQVAWQPASQATRVGNRNAIGTGTGESWMELAWVAVPVPVHRHRSNDIIVERRRQVAATKFVMHQNKNNKCRGKNATLHLSTRCAKKERKKERKKVRFYGTTRPWANGMGDSKYHLNTRILAEIKYHQRTFIMSTHSVANALLKSYLWSYVC